MKINKLIKESWKNPIENKEFTKKDFMTFKPQTTKNISLKLYLGTVLSLCFVFALTIFAFAQKPITENSQSSNPTIERLPKPNSQFDISFGIIDPAKPTLEAKHISQLEFRRYDFLESRNEFAAWFNSLNLVKANVSYKAIKLDNYVANLQPVKITQLNDSYSIYFTDQNYLIICYKDYFIFYDLVNADILLEQFFQK